MANRFLSDVIGIAGSFFKLGFLGVRLKNVSGNLAVRNTGDSADAAVTASQDNVSGDVIVLNSDAAASGADWSLTIQRAATGMGAAWTWTLPPNDGSPGQVLTTDGSGITTWETIPSGSPNGLLFDVTALAFGDSSPHAMFTKPAGSKVDLIRVYVDTAFDGTTPQLSIGIAGTTSKYMATGEIDLKTVGVYEVVPDVDVVVGTEALIATYAADSSATGAARIEVIYGVPT